ncbi:MAG: plastocyanin/azurin family copper-binding protein [Bacteroidota bacterium]
MFKTTITALLVFSLSLSLTAQLSMAALESEYYQISTVSIPEGVVLEAGGLAFNEKGQLAVSTRRGEVWQIDNPESDNPTFTRFATGLHEPLGLAYKDGSYFLAQRAELTKLTDNNKDGKADQYETIHAWDLEGNYHEYSYGPVLLPNGNMLVTLNLGWIGRGASLSKWRGWMLMISPEGELTPIATGMRSPAGFGLNANGDIFYTENQGDWVGSGRMTHIEKGDFVGHPEGLKWSSEANSPLELKRSDIQDTSDMSLYEYAKIHEAIKPPSVWFPHTLMGISTSDMAVLPDDFGPFAGQLLVGDQGHSKVMRVFQEKVKDTYQGACFGFKEGFASGLLRMKWSPNNKLYVGMTNRGWASTGKAPFGLQRLEWTGKIPFEMKAIRAMSDGFEIEFTQAADRRTAANPDSYSITDFTYKYHHLYGSPAINQEDRTVYKVALSQDSKKARLYIEGMREGYVYEVKAAGVKNETGKSILHPTAYYTLNYLPDGARIEAKEADDSGNITMPTVELKSEKRITKMPSSWLNGPEQVIEIGTLAGMRYDVEELSVKAGTKVKLSLNNPDDMMHNLLIVKPNTIDRVADLAMNLGLKGAEMGYVPKDDAVLFHTNLLGPNSSDVIYFTVPDKPGKYEFVCTFPAHAQSMRGVLNVVQ